MNHLEKKNESDTPASLDEDGLQAQHQQVQARAKELEQRVSRRTAALRVSQARFRAIFEDAPLGIAVLNREGHILESNAALEAILGRDAASLRDMHFSAYLDTQDTEVGPLMFSDPAAAVDERQQYEMRLLRSDGQLTWCNLTIALVRAASEEPELLILMVDDITQRREAQAAMAQNEKLALTGQLAASLAHEINNPLQTVIGCLGLADESLRDIDSVPESIHVYLEMAQQELKRASGIVGRLRDLSRPSEPEEKMLVHPRHLVDQVFAISGKQCLDRGIRVNVHAGPDVPAVMIVPDRIHQVLLNLVLNAIDAMPRGGELSVSLQRTSDPQGVTITMCDSGSGISSAVQEHLFEPFQTTKSEGLGLGLYISRNIVQDHGGTISVQGGPGEGTTFSVWLPA